MNSLVLFGALIAGVTCYPKLTTSGKERSKLSLSDFSVCCTVPELATAPAIQQCSNPRAATVCGDHTCLFESAGWLKGNTIDKQAFKKQLKNLASKDQRWTVAVDRAIADCIDKDPKKLANSCDPYDLISCVSLAFIKKCPTEAWKC